MTTDVPRETGWYDSVYSEKSYYHGMGELPFYSHVWRFVMTKLPSPPCTILDVGCGTGQFDRLCADKGYKIIGLDFSKVAVENAKKLVPDGIFELVDFRASPDLLSRYKANVFTILETLEHLGDDIGLVRSIPHGTPVIVSVPNIDGQEHIRFFRSAAEVSTRYGSFFKDPMVFGRVDPGNAAVVHYVLTGIRNALS